MNSTRQAERHVILGHCIYVIIRRPDRNLLQDRFRGLFHKYLFALFVAVAIHLHSTASLRRGSAIVSSAREARPWLSLQSASTGVHEFSSAAWRRVSGWLVHFHGVTSSTNAGGPTRCACFDKRPPSSSHTPRRQWPGASTTSRGSASIRVLDRARTDQPIRPGGASDSDLVQRRQLRWRGSEPYLTVGIAGNPTGCRRGRSRSEASS